MKNKSTVLRIILGIIITLGLCITYFSQHQIQTTSSEKIKVATSFYPLYYFVSEIGREHIIADNLTPAGAEPHDFEPNAQDIAKLQSTHLLIVNGAGFEPWLDEVKEDLQKNNVKIVIPAEGLATLHINEDGENTTDPHIWLDPLLAKQEVEKITQALIEIDPKNQSSYKANGQQLEARLMALDQEFSVGLSQCQQKNIVTSHQAFGYLAARYGLKQVAIAGISPEQEPSPTELGEIARFAKNNNVKFIFFETLVNPRLAETLAQEIGAQTLVFDPLEGLEEKGQAAGKNYFSVQQENLKNLKIALECE